jgi:gliding motility-associated-like protein
MLICAKVVNKELILSISSFFNIFALGLSYSNLMGKSVYFFILLMLITFVNVYSLNLTDTDTCSVSILQNDTIIYTQDNTPIQIQLNATQGAYSYKWTPSDGLSNDTIPNPILTVSTTSQYVVEALYLDTANGINLVYNGDFELGNVGFTTQYNHEVNPNPAFGPGDYNVVTNTNQAGSGFLSCQNGGLFFIADASLIANIILYQISVNVEPNTYYLFTTETTNFLSFNNNDLPVIEYNINNHPLRLDTIRDVNCDWQEYSYIWYNDNSSTALITIKDLNTIQMGNDFAMDNISLKKICKTTDTINIVFAPMIIEDTIYVTLCENELPYIYHDSIFSQAGAYTYLFTNDNGILDSAFIINLSVLPSYVNTIDATICQGEVYNQNDFNESVTGVYTRNYQTLEGCDSLIVLNLIVEPSFSNTISATICQGETYNENGFNISTSGNYNKTFQSINGCDSTINLVLIVEPLKDTTIYDTIYSGSVYYRFGFNQTTSGMYINSYQLGEGCPTEITLNLEVIDIPDVNVWVPNAFTPFELSNNEFGYYTELNYLSSVSFKIYNRWGERIFFSTKIGEFWNGKYKGQDCHTGVYAWKLTYATIFAPNENIELSGLVNLIK